MNIFCIIVFSLEVLNLAYIINSQGVRKFLFVCLGIHVHKKAGNHWYSPFASDFFIVEIESIEGFFFTVK